MRRRPEQLSMGEWAVLALVDEGPTPSESGPPRTLVRATADGAKRVAAWLNEPVEHVRDARSALMLKLLFLDRRDADPAELLAAQREKLVSLEQELRDTLDEADGFARTLALWRIESTAATIRFLDALAR